MPPLQTVTYTLACLIFGGSLWLFVRWIVGDRAKHRRRCPECWYDLSGVAEATCPECGRDLAHARLYRTRRRPRWFIGATLLMLLGVGMIWGQGLYNKGWDAVPTFVLAESFRYTPGTPTIDRAHDAYIERIITCRVGRESVERVAELLFRQAEIDPRSSVRRDVLDAIRSIENRILFARLPEGTEPRVEPFHFGEALTDQHTAALRVFTSDPDPDVQSLAWIVLADASRSRRHADLIPELLAHVADDFVNRLDLLRQIGGISFAPRKEHPARPMLVWPDPEAWNSGFARYRSHTVQMSYDVEIAMIDAMRNVSDAWQYGDEIVFTRLLERLCIEPFPGADDPDRAIARFGFWMRVRMREGEPDTRAFILERAREAVETAPDEVRVSLSPRTWRTDLRTTPDADLAVEALGYYPEDDEAIDLIGRAIREGQYEVGYAAIRACRYIPEDRLRPLRETLAKAAILGVGPGTRSGWTDEAVEHAVRAGESREQLLARLLNEGLLTEDPHLFSSIVTSLDIRDRDAAALVRDEYDDALSDLKAAEQRRNNSSTSMLRTVRSRAFNRTTRPASQLLVAYTVLSGDTKFATQELLDHLVYTAPSADDLKRSQYRHASSIVFGRPPPEFSGLLRSEYLHRPTLAQAVREHTNAQSRFWALVGLWLYIDQPLTAAEVEPFARGDDPRMAELARLILNEIRNRP